MSQAPDRRAEELFHAALELRPDGREAFLRERCGGDERLRERVERLVRLHDSADRVLASPTDGLAGAAPVEEDGQRWIGARIGPFRVVRSLGRGGMGLVVLAEQDHPRRQVALKLLDSPRVTGESWRRFGHEIDVLAALDHPGIARVLEAGSESTPSGTVRYFAMEFVDGSPMRALIGKAGLTQRAMLGLIADIADAVAHAHAHGIVHRDLKPENVLIVEDRRTGALQPKVLDFGIAKSLGDDVPELTLRTQTGFLLGTLEYMSPEQIDAKPGSVDQRADVYALGVMLYELATGRMPYNVRGSSLTDAARIIRYEEAVRPSALVRALRGEIETVIAKAMEKDPVRRYRDAGELAADLRRILDDQPIVARPPSTLYRVIKFTLRNRGLVTGVAAVLVTLLAGLGATTCQALRATRASREALLHADQAELESYVASVAAAAHALRNGDGVTARVRLDAAPARLRSFEWWHLRAKLDESVATLTGPMVGANAVAVSSSGSHVAAAGGSAACVWKHDTRERVFTLRRPTPRTTRIALDDAGTLLAVFGGTLSEQLEVHELAMATAHALTLPARILDATFDPSGELVAIDVEGRLTTVGADHRTMATTALSGAGLELARIAPDASRAALVTSAPVSALNVVDRVSARTLWSLSLGGARVGELAFSSDGGSFAFIDSTGVLHLLDAQNGVELDRFSPSDPAARALALSPLGRFCATADSESSIEIFERGRGPRAIAQRAGHRAAVTALVFTAEDELVSCSSDGSVKLWTLGAASLEHQSIQEAAFDSSGRLFARTQDLRELRVLDARTGRVLATLATDPGQSWECVAPDGSLVALYGALVGDVVVLEVATGREVARLLHPGEEVVRAAFRPDSSQIATLTRTAPGAVRLWSLPDGRELARFDASSHLGPRLCFSGDGAWLACAPERGGVLVWDVEERRIGLELEPGFGGFTAIDREPGTSVFAAAGLDGVLRLFDAESGATRRIHTTCRQVFALAFIPGSGRLALLDTVAGLRLFDLALGREVAHLLDTSSETPRSLAASPDGSLLAACDGSDESKYGLRIFDALTPGDRLARSLLDELFLPAAALARIDAIADLPAETRAQAIAYAGARGADPASWNQDAWELSCFPDAPRSDYERAVRLSRAALAVDPDNGLYLNTLGAALYRVGELREAERTLERAIELNGGRIPVDFSLMALTQAALGNVEKARAAFVRASSPDQWRGGTPGALLAEAERALAAAFATSSPRASH